MRRARNATLLLGALALGTAGCAGDLGPENDSQIDDDPAFSMLSDNKLGLGEARLIDFGPNSTITKVYVRLRQSIASKARNAGGRLDITITSVDGIDHFHGTALIPLEDVVEVARSRSTITGEITWTEDNEPQVVGDLYTVCSTLQIDGPQGTSYGPERCQEFGPYF